MYGIGFLNESVCINLEKGVEFLYNVLFVVDYVLWVIIEEIEVLMYVCYDGGDVNVCVESDVCIWEMMVVRKAVVVMMVVESKWVRCVRCVRCVWVCDGLNYYIWYFECVIGVIGFWRWSCWVLCCERGFRRRFVLGDFVVERFCGFLVYCKCFGFGVR